MEQVDLDKYVQIIIKHKNLFLVLTIVVAAIFYGFSLYGKHSTKTADYKKEIQEKLQKMEVVSVWEKSKETLNKYKASFIKRLNEESLLNQLSDYALQNNISILNISPGQVTTKEDYSMTNVKLNIKAESFKDLVSFFYTMETAPYVFKINDWSVALESEKDPFVCNVDIVFVQMR